MVQSWLHYDNAIPVSCQVFIEVLILQIDRTQLYYQITNHSHEVKTKYKQNSQNTGIYE